MAMTPPTALPASLPTGILDTVLERVSDGFATMDGDWRCTYINQHGAELLGRKREELVGSHIWRDFPANVGKPFHEACQRAVREQRPLRLEDYFGAQQRWFLTRIYPSSDGVTIFFADITAQKRAEAAVAEAREFADAVIDALPGVFYLLDEAGRSLRWNAAFGPALGYTAEELKALHPARLFAEPAAFARDLRAGFEHGEVSDMAELVARDGRRLSYRFSARAVTLGGRRLLLGSGVDVTNQVRAEQRLEKAFLGAPEAMSISDIDSGRLLLVNDAFCRTFGYPREKLIGRTSKELGMWSGTTAREELVAALREGRGVREVEGRARTGAGELRDLVYSGEAIDFGGERRLLLMFHDVTDRKRAEMQAREQARQLEALSRQLLSAQEEERGRLARELHDEIGQVLTAVRLNLKTVERAAPGGLAREAVADSLASVEQAIAQVRSMSLDLRPPLLEELGIAAALRWLAERQPVPVSLSLPSPEPVLPPHLSIACYRVVQEALTNVARHARATRVELALVHEGGRVAVSVRDDGCGFDPAAQRGRASFGLLGMEERVALIGGTLRVTSAPGAGTEVRAAFGAGA